MTPERFQRIIEAYGADSCRWPAEERQAAETFLLEAPSMAAAIAQEAELDSLLQAYRTEPPDSALTGAIIASANTRRRMVGAWLFQGLGLAGAWLAGAVAGAFLITVYTTSTPTFFDESGQPILTSFDRSSVDSDADDAL